MAGNDAIHDTKIVDSSGYSMARYVDWYSARYGKTSVKYFVKLHLRHTPHDKIYTAMVTPEDANDSPYLRGMMA